MIVRRAQRRRRAAARAGSACSRARVDRLGDVGSSAHSDVSCPLRASRSASAVPHAPAPITRSASGESRRDENREHDDETDRQRAAGLSPDARLPNRCSSPLRSRAMFARCVQKTNAATSTLITNSGDRTPTRESKQHRKHRRADQRAERHVATREHDDGEDEQREERLNGREREKNAGRRRHALPALAELEVDRSHVADDRRDAADDRRR